MQSQGQIWPCFVSGKPCWHVPILLCTAAFALWWPSVLAETDCTAYKVNDVCSVPSQESVADSFLYTQSCHAVIDNVVILRGCERMVIRGKLYSEFLDFILFLQCESLWQGWARSHS